MGCRPRAGSVLRCHGVLVLRQGPLTAAVQDEGQLQEDASKLAVGSVDGQAKPRFVEAVTWQPAGGCIFLLQPSSHTGFAASFSSAVTILNSSATPTRENLIMLNRAGSSCARQGIARCHKSGKKLT